MVIIIFFILHWYLSLFTQTFFLHRYASHRAFTMSRFWEKTFFVFSYLMQGSSYLSPRAYAVMHRMHHAFTDTDKDPHAPKNFNNVFSFMWQTAIVYAGIYDGSYKTEERFSKNLPEWNSFERFATSWTSKIIWVVLYFAFYIMFAHSWWLFLLFLILTAIII